MKKYIYLHDYRSLHTESEIFVRNFCTLKNKYDLTLCQSRLHTASEIFVRQKKFGSGSIFCVFASVACILIGKDEEYEEKRLSMQWPYLLFLERKTTNSGYTSDLIWK